MTKPPRPEKERGHVVTWLLVSKTERAFVIAVLCLAAQLFAHSWDTNTPIAIDYTPAERMYGPNQDDTCGALSKSGSYARGARCVREGFAPKDIANAGAFVEIVTFPKGYSYAEHDLFGLLLRSAAYDRKNPRHRSLLGAAQDKVVCLQWTRKGATGVRNICYVSTIGDRGPGGVVGWFKGNPEDGVVTVVIGYRHPSGQLPGQVIDRFLREYPSDVPENPTWHHDWEIKDIAKWQNVLQSNKDDRLMLQAGATYLMRYDKRSFGLFDALAKRDNAAAFSQAFDGVQERMSRWLAENQGAKKNSRIGD